MTEGILAMKIEGHSFLRRLLTRCYADAGDPVRQAVLDSTYFIDPEVVAQTKCLPVLRARRMDAAAGERKSSIAPDGIFVSDNFPPDYVFRAATSDKRDQGTTHLCHIYGGKGEARETFFYTNLANLCLVPSFLAKLADTDDSVVNLLKECSFVLYGFDPKCEMRGRQVDGLRERIQIAAPPATPLFEVLGRKDNAKFRCAKQAGFLFSAAGEINSSDPWVSEMVRRGTVT